jgi:hypothetical protein
MCEISIYETHERGSVGIGGDTLEKKIQYNDNSTVDRNKCIPVRFRYLCVHPQPWKIGASTPAVRRRIHFGQA